MDDFLKQNIQGPWSKLFLAGYVRDIATADNKWKAVGRTILEMAKWTSRLVLPAAFISGFLAMGRAVRTILVDTGSLDAALRRLSQIQGLQRAFTPLLGGLAAAKQRVAELVQFTARNRFFKFEEVGEASRRLELFTRGAYSSNEALMAVQNTALKSGNGIAEVADAVGGFYADLRGGKPIEQATEQLRQMGVISNQTADYLNGLQKSGAGAQAIFGELQGVLAGAKPSGAGDDVATIQQRHAEAAKNLKQQFGAAFTDDETQNVKNYTDAMNALAPSVGRLGGFFSTLTGGLSTAKSSLAKFAAENDLIRSSVEGLVKITGILVAGAAAFGAVFATVRIASFALAIEGASAAAVGLQAALFGLAAVPIVGLIAVATGVIIHLANEQRKATKQAEEWAAAHREAIASIAGEGAAVDTLVDKQEALAKSIQKEIDLRKERQALIDKEHPVVAELEMTPDEKAANRGKIEQLEKQEKIQRRISEIIAGKTGVISPERAQAIKAEAERGASLQEEQKGVEQRETEARGGLAAAAGVGDRRDQLQNEVTRKQKELDADKAAFEERRAQAGKGLAVKIPREEQTAIRHGFRNRQDELNALEAQQLGVGLGAPESSSVFLDTRAQQLIHAQAADAAEAKVQALQELGGKDEELKAARTEARRQRELAGGQQFTPQALAATQAQAEIARQREGQAGALGTQVRQARVQQFELATEIAGHQARRAGNIPGAQAQEDILRFTQHFEELLPAMGKQKAASEALAQSQDEIAQEYTGGQGVVSSLQAIGGGGNISGVDPLTQSARRREELQSRMVALLEILTGQDSVPSNIPTFQ